MEKKSHEMNEETSSGKNVKASYVRLINAKSAIKKMERSVKPTLLSKLFDEFENERQVKVWKEAMTLVCELGASSPAFIQSAEELVAAKEAYQKKQYNSNVYSTTEVTKAFKAASVVFSKQGDDLLKKSGATKDHLSKALPTAMHEILLNRTFLKPVDDLVTGLKSTVYSVQPK